MRQGGQRVSPVTVGSLRVWGLIAGIGAGLPTVLGGCSIAFDLYMRRVNAAYGQADWPPRAPAPATPTIEDRRAAVYAPFAIAPGPAISQLLSPADRRYLLDRGTVRLRRRFPGVVAVESRQAAAERGFATVFEVDVVDSLPEENAMMRFVLRVWRADGTLASVIQGQLFDVQARRASQRATIDAALPLIDAKTDMLLRPFHQ